MAKTNGAALTTLSIDDSGGTPADLRNDFTDFDFSIDSAQQDVTGLDKSALERLALLADFTINIRGVVNVAAGLSHDVFKDIAGGVARTTSFGHAGITLVNEVLFANYSWTRAADASLTFNTTGALSDGTVPTFGP